MVKSRKCGDVMGGGGRESQVCRWIDKGGVEREILREGEKEQHTGDYTRTTRPQNQ